MFNNIGKKIKLMSKCACWIGIVGSVLGACILWMQHGPNNPTIGLGFTVLFGGCFVSWIGSLFSYGFGELVDYASQELSKNPQSKHIQMNKWQCSECLTINSGSSCSNCGKNKSAIDRKCS